MTIEITQFELHSWYRNQQGQRYKVKALTGGPDYYVVISGDEIGLFIRKEDCKIIEEQDEFFNTRC